jgi:hypothetical protein
MNILDDGIINEYEAVGGMRTGTGNHSTRRKPAPSDILSATNPTRPRGIEPGSWQWEADTWNVKFSRLYL